MVLLSYGHIIFDIILHIVFIPFSSTELIFLVFHLSSYLCHYQEINVLTMLSLYTEKPKHESLTQIHT